jgi:hypothetical protein
MRHVLLGAFLAASALAGAAPASADIVSFTYSGHVTDGTDVSGIFGPAGADLTGDALRAVFVFDTSLGVRGTVPGTTDSVIGGTQVPGSPATPLISATLILNGISVSIGGELLGSAITDAGMFNASEAVEDDLDFVSAFVDTPDAPASLDTPFTPHGVGGGSFNLERLDPLTGQMQMASGDFSIPEPASWALMLTGFGGVGATLRRRRTPSLA